MLCRSAKKRASPRLLDMISESGIKSFPTGKKLEEKEEEEEENPGQVNLLCFFQLICQKFVYLSNFQGWILLAPSQLKERKVNWDTWLEEKDLLINGNNFCFCLFIDYNLFILVLCICMCILKREVFKYCLEKQERCMQKCCIQTSAYHHQFSSSLLHQSKVSSDGSDVRFRLHLIKSCCTLRTSKKGRRYQRISSI